MPVELVILFTVLGLLIWFIVGFLGGLVIHKDMPHIYGKLFPFGISFGGIIVWLFAIPSIIDPWYLRK